MAKIACFSCQAPLSAGDRYCRRCGAWRNEGRRHLLDWLRDPRLFTFFALLAAVELAVIVSMSRELGIQGRSSFGGTGTEPVVSPAEADLDARVLAVAGDYSCGCGSCSGDTLAACDCTHPRGAVETKGWIRELLRQGKGENEVRALLVERFGKGIERRGEGSVAD